MRSTTVIHNETDLSVLAIPHCSMRVNQDFHCMYMFKFYTSLAVDVDNDNDNKLNSTYLVDKNHFPALRVFYIQICKEFRLPKTFLTDKK